MLNLTGGDRASLSRANALDVDQDGEEVFVGLSHAESQRYQILSDPLRACSLSEHLEFLKLDEKHVQAHLLRCGQLLPESTDN